MLGKPKQNVYHLEVKYFTIAEKKKLKQSSKTFQFWQNCFFSLDFSVKTLWPTLINICIMSINICSLWRCWFKHYCKIKSLFTHRIDWTWATAVQLFSTSSLVSRSALQEDAAAGPTTGGTWGAVGVHTCQRVSCTPWDLIYNHV